MLGIGSGCVKLSTKGEYGLRAMYDLAELYGEGPISLKSVAARQDISEPYLEQLFALLKKSGIVKSVRGAQGGYTLSKEPREITVGEVIYALEGSFAPMDCVSTSNVEQCKRAEFCVTRQIWSKVKVAVDNVLDGITLQDMKDEAIKIRSGKDYYMYYI